jgi:Holliday junction resolvase RusA-like endonuclease
MHIAIDPLPCPRPRIVAKPFPHAYYPKSYKVWKEEASQLLTPLVPSAPLIGPLVVRVTFTCPRPKTTKLSCPKPDIDNYAKSFMDALTAVGWWEDDSQVVGLQAVKRWGPAGDITFDVSPFCGGEVFAQ